MELVITLVKPRFRKKKMLEVCRIHNGWILHTERSVKKIFQYCLNTNGHPCVPSTVIQAEPWLTPALLDDLEMPRWMKRVPSGSFTMHFMVQAGLMAGGKDQRRTADCLLHTTRRIKIFSRMTKGKVQKQVGSYPGRSFLDQHETSTEMKDYKSGKPGLMPLLFTTQCQQSALRKWQAPDVMRFCIKDFLLRDRLTKLC